MPFSDTPSAMDAPKAIIICDEFCDEKVASVSLLDRLVISSYRAGCKKLVIVGKYKPESLLNTHRLGIHYENRSSVDSCEPLTLVAYTGALVVKEDIEKILAVGGRLSALNGDPLPVGRVKSTDGSLEGLEPVPCLGPSLQIRSARDCRRAEQMLWDALESDTDGYVDILFNRPMGRPLSRLLLRTSISPNQITLFALFLGCLSGMGFGIGTHGYGILGAVMLQLSAVFDCIDGDLARIGFRESRIGKWLDIVCDQIVHAVVFGGIAVGVYRHDPDGIYLVLGLSCVLGVILAFVVVVKARLSRESNHPMVRVLMDKAATRDFSVLLLFLAAADRLHVFLWACGLGIHLFWMFLFIVWKCSPFSPALRETDEQT